MLLAILVAGASKSPFTVHDKAYYVLQAHDLSFTPGVVAKMKSANIAPDGTIRADFALKDPAGGPLNITGVQTAGSIEVGLVIAVLPKAQEQYVAYTTSVKQAPNGVSAVQAAYDQGGTLQEVNRGEYVYTFTTKAPAGFDATLGSTVLAPGAEQSSLGPATHPANSPVAAMLKRLPLERGRGAVARNLSANLQIQLLCPFQRRIVTPAIGIVSCGVPEPEGEAGCSCIRDVRAT